MPTERAKKRAAQDKKEGKAATTQAGEFVREEMEKYKKGTGRAQSQKQAVAIGLSEARREGVALPARKKSAAKRTTKSRSTTKRKKS